MVLDTFTMVNIQNNLYHASKQGTFREGYLKVMDVFTVTLLECFSVIWPLIMFSHFLMLLLVSECSENFQKYHNEP